MFLRPWMVLACMAAAGSLTVMKDEPPAKLDGDAIHISASWFGDHSKVTQREYKVVTSEIAWRDLWMKHEPLSDDRQRQRTLPKIDFEHYFVVAIFQGEGWNSHGVYVVEAAAKDDRVTVRYDEHTYQTSGPDGGGVRVEAYGFFILPRSGTRVVLEENVQNLIGKPAKWKQRAELEIK